ncbi:hypothetical protein [Bermanella sp. R86510]|uniref:hypothetical protein n=1 Tax=unclassified Bermanella TaxID=2627862 RepID=UPI0037C9967C
MNSVMNRAVEIDESLTQLHQNQQTRLRALDLIKSLYEQVRVIQQHRAATNGALAGNPFFETRTGPLAREVNARFKELSRQKQCVESISDETLWQEIELAWQTVHQQWRQDDVIENFELHSHLVKQILQYIGLLGDRAEELIETHFQYQALGHYVFHDLPWFIELLGQIRALGTSAAISGRIEKPIEMRLRFLMGQLLNQQEVVRQQAQKLSKEALDITSSLIDALLCQPKLERLTGLVHHDLLSGKKIVTTADEFYSLATAIIDAHYKVMNEGLRLLRLSMDKRIQAWVKQPAVR